VYRCLSKTDRLQLLIKTMKNLKTGLMALVLTLGVAGAVATKVHAAPKFDDPIYNWSDDDSNSTVSVAEDRTGCIGDQAVCATGTLVSGHPGDPQTVNLRFVNP
jgi:hypothetical protein